MQYKRKLSQQGDGKFVGASNVLELNMHREPIKSQAEFLRNKNVISGGSGNFVFVSFPQKRNGIVFSSGVNYLHSGSNIQSE